MVFVIVWLIIGFIMVIVNVIIRNFSFFVRGKFDVRVRVRSMFIVFFVLYFVVVCSFV